MSAEEVSWKTLELIMDIYRRFDWTLPPTFDEAVQSVFLKLKTSQVTIR